MEVKSVRLYITTKKEFFNELYNFYKGRRATTKLLGKKGINVIKLKKCGY